MNDTTIIRGVVYHSKRDFLIAEGTSISLSTKEVRFEVFTHIELPFKPSDYEPQVDWDSIAEELGNPPRIEFVLEGQVIDLMEMESDEDQMYISSTYTAYTITDPLVVFA